MIGLTVVAEASEARPSYKPPAEPTGDRDFIRSSRPISPARLAFFGLFASSPTRTTKRGSSKGGKLGLAVGNVSGLVLYSAAVDWSESVHLPADVSGPGADFLSLM